MSKLIPRLAIWTITIMVLLAVTSQEAMAQWTPRNKENMKLMGGISTEKLLLYGAAAAVTAVVLVHALNTSAKPDSEKVKETTDTEETNAENENDGAGAPPLNTQAFQAGVCSDAVPAAPQETKIIPLVGLAMTPRADGTTMVPSLTLGVMVNF